ncbi:MAG: DoxX family protein [Candidatus Binatia bacterium]
MRGDRALDHWLWRLQGRERTIRQCGYHFETTETPNDSNYSTLSHGNGGESPRSKPAMNLALWIAQGLLATIFLFAGGMKLVMPIEEMLRQMPLPLPGLFVRFIGVCEVLGAIGVILPWLLRIRPGLTPLAAAGLVIVMIGATAYSLAAGNMASALIPLAAGVLAAFVAYGRWRPAPQRG